MPELNVIGVELNPPKENWVLACIGDDDLRDEVRDFTKKVYTGDSTSTRRWAFFAY